MYHVLGSKILWNIFHQLILPLQSNPSPLYPVLHVQVKLPSVLAQAAFLSQGVDAHSSISIKKCYKGNVYSVDAIKKVINITIEKWYHVIN